MNTAPRSPDMTEGIPQLKDTEYVKLFFLRAGLSFQVGRSFEHKAAFFWVTVIVLVYGNEVQFISMEQDSPLYVWFLLGTRNAGKENQHPVFRPHFSATPRAIGRRNLA